MINRTRTSGRKPYTDEQVADLLGQHGFRMVGEYQGFNNLLSVECPKGHTSEVRLCNFKKTKHKCRYCAGNVKLFQHEVEERFRGVGLTLLEPYTNRRTKLLAICDRGHEVRISYQSIHNGNGCIECAGVRLRTHEEVEKEFSDRGFKLLSEYQGVFGDLSVQCPSGHKFTTSRHSFLKTTNGCPYCTGVRLDEQGKHSSQISRRIRIRVAQRLSMQGLPKLYELGEWPNQVARAVVLSYGPRPEGYELDHIIPCSYFDHSDPAQTRLCWHIKNLRWLSREENYTRRANLTLEEVAKFSPIQKYILRKATLKPSRFYQI